MEKYKKITKEEAVKILENWKSDKIKVEITEENMQTILKHGKKSK